MLACDSLIEAAQHGVDWLVQRTSVQQVAVLLVDLERPSGPRLVVAASSGLSFGAENVSIDLEEREDAIVHALGARKPLLLGADPRFRFREKKSTAYRLPTMAEREAIGVAVLGGSLHDADARWMLGVMGRRLQDLRNLRVLGTTERRLERERALLQSILKAVPDPVLLTDPEGRLLVANARAELYFASEEEESEGRRRAVALNNMLFSAALSRHAIEGNELERRELPLVDPSDGSDRLFEVMSAPIVTPDGPGIVSVLRNVTDLQAAAQEIEDNYRRLRLAEAEVRAERDRLDVIIDSVADPIIVTDANGATMMTNSPAERLFSASGAGPVEEMLRVRANDAHFSSHVSNLFFVDSMREGGRFIGELGLTDPISGRSVPVEAISGKITTDQGEVTAIVTILHDRTAKISLEDKVRDATAELVRQNELLQRQALELEAASSAKSQFLANMSHEIRTPLNAILGYTSMLIQGVSGPLAPAVDRQLRRVDSNGKHLLTIINDILDIARIEAGKMPLNVTKFPLPELVHEVLAEVDPLIVKSKLGVKIEIGRGLWPIESDRPKVKQILMNLISNALKFTPKGSVTISAQANKRRSEIWLSVADTGIGIADVDQETVFQAFRQVDNSPTRQYGGTGLGLAICQRLAAVLGGEIRLVSQVGKGSTFTLVLGGSR